MVMKKISKMDVVLAAILAFALGCTEQSGNDGATEKSPEHPVTSAKKTGDNEATEDTEFINLKVTGMT